MPMEEESACSSLPDITDSVVQRPQRDAWTSIDHQCTAGEQQVESNHSTGQLLPSPKAGRDSPEAAQQSEEIVWPLCHKTSTSRLLSFATVQWEMTDHSAEASSPVTDSGVASEPSCGCATTVDAASPSPRRSRGASAGLSTPEVGEEEGGSESQFLSSNLERTGNVSEVFAACEEPCDAADAQEPPSQERDDSSHDPLDSNNEIPSTIDTEGEEGHSATADAVEAVDVFDVPEEIDGSQKEQALHAGHVTEKETEEGGDGEAEEEQSLTNLSCSAESEEAQGSSLSAVEVPAPPPQTDDTGPTVNPSQVGSELISAARVEQPPRVDPDKLIDLLQHTGSREETQRPESLQEDPTGQTDESELCKDVAQTLDPKQSDGGEPLVEQAAGNAERTENSQETLELTREPEEASCLQHQQCGHTTSQEPRSKHSVCVEAVDPGATEQREQTAPSEQSERTTNVSRPAPSQQLARPETGESEIAEQSVEAGLDQGTSHGGKDAGGGEGGSERRVVADGEHPDPPDPPETAEPRPNGHGVDRGSARRLAGQLHKLEGIRRVDVVKHIDKDNDFSRAVGEEYLKFFDFTGMTLILALRAFLKVVVLIGETQERERVLQHFAHRFHQCNPDSLSSSDAVFALTCALMLLNTDLHGQNVGKAMSSSKFVSNLDGMNEGGNFNKQLLKSLYSSIKSEPLQWAVDEEESESSDEDQVDYHHFLSRKAPMVKHGIFQRKFHADVDGKRTAWGKRRWTTFFGVLRRMVLFLHHVDDKGHRRSDRKLVKVHHSLAEQATDYIKRPHVFRLQTADRRVFLFQASSSVEMSSWIGRINLVSALHSSPPFPAAVGSQRRFFRPILPAVQSEHTVERQLKTHSGTLESFKKDLSHLQKNPPEGRKSQAKELQELRLRAEYLQHEVCRFETYIQVLGAWRSVKKTDDDLMSNIELKVFDKAMLDGSVGQRKDEDGLKKSQSSRSLEMLPRQVIKVRRNISDRWTPRRPFIPQWDKDN